VATANLAFVDTVPKDPGSTEFRRAVLAAAMDVRQPRTVI
jgi:hypothetical protein